MVEGRELVSSPANRCAFYAAKPMPLWRNAYTKMGENDVLSVSALYENMVLNY